MTWQKVTWHGEFYSFSLPKTSGIRNWVNRKCHSNVQALMHFGHCKTISRPCFLTHVLFCTQNHILSFSFFLSVSFFFFSLSFPTFPKVWKCPRIFTGHARMSLSFFLHSLTQERRTLFLRRVRICFSPSGALKVCRENSDRNSKCQ